jgi:hypothetical protein
MRMSFPTQFVAVTLQSLPEVPDPKISLSDYVGSCGVLADQCAFEAADVLLAQTCCAPMGSLSAADLYRECRNDVMRKMDSHVEARLIGGYSQLMEWYCCS